MAIFPGDAIVADGDGAVVIPQAMLAEVTEAAAEQEARKAWIMGEMKRACRCPAFIRPMTRTRREYAAWRKDSKK